MNLFLIIDLKQIKLIINIIVYTSMMKKSSYDLSSTNIKIKITFFIEDTILKKVKLQIERGKFKRCR